MRIEGTRLRKKGMVVHVDVAKSPNRESGGCEPCRRCRPDTAEVTEHYRQCQNHGRFHAHLVLLVDPFRPGASGKVGWLPLSGNRQNATSPPFLADVVDCRRLPRPPTVLESSFSTSPCG